MKMPETYYDVIIIGGGISGLTSSALLSKTGLKSCVFEINKITGGYLAGFNRNGFKFDTAIHWLNDCNENGFVSKIFRIIDKNFPKAETQKEIRRFVNEDSNFLITNNPDKLKDKLINKFPEDKKGINKFFRDAKRISKSFNNYYNLGRSAYTMNLFRKLVYGFKMLKFVLPFIPHIKYSGNKGVTKGLNKYSKNREFQNIFKAENDLLSCLVPVAWAYSNNYQKTPEGGSRAYPYWLTEASEKNGSKIFLNSEVTEVLVDNKTVTGVKVKINNEIHEIKCKYVVAACDAETLFNKLLPENSVSQNRKEKLKNVDLYSSAFTVSIALDCTAEELGFGEENIYFFDTSVNRVDLSKGDAYKSGIHISASSVKDKTLAPSGQGILSLFIPAWIENNNFWECEKDEKGKFKRGEKYQKLKKKYAEILINRVQEKFAHDLRKHILFYDVATPITYLRYTGNKNGTMMGQRPGKDNIKNKVASYKTPVNNLFQSGHWADFGGGVLIAVKSALNTSLIILKKEKPQVFKLLANYIDGKSGIESIENSYLKKN